MARNGCSFTSLATLIPRRFTRFPMMMYHYARRLCRFKVSRITFSPGYHLGRVRLEPEGQDLQIEKTPRGTSVVVPQLAIHLMVVAELEQPAAR